MKRILLPLIVTASAVGIFLLLLFHRPALEVDIAVVHPRPAEKTVLTAGKVTDRTHVQLFLRESLADTIQEGQSAVVNGVGFRRKDYPGTVVAVAKEATVQNGKTGLLADVLLDESQTDDSIKPGLTATVRITVEMFESVIVAEEAWFLSESDSPAVYVLEDGKAVRRRVTAKEQVDGGVIVEGLSENERIILDPQSVRDRQNVKEKRA